MIPSRPMPPQSQLQDASREMKGTDGNEDRFAMPNLKKTFAGVFSNM